MQKVDDTDFRAQRCGLGVWRALGYCGCHGLVHLTL